MDVGIRRRLAYIAVATIAGVISACASGPSATTLGKVESNTDDYVSRLGSDSPDAETSARNDSARAKSMEPVASGDAGTSEAQARGGAKPASSGGKSDLKALSEYYANEAVRRYRDQRFKDALEYANDALLMDEKNATALQVKADSEQMLGFQRGPAENMARARSEEEAATRAEALYEISRTIDEGRRLIRQGKYTESLSELEKALDLIRWTNYLVPTEAQEREARLLMEEAKTLREKARLEDFVKVREQERRLRELEIQQELDRYREQVRNLYDLAKEYFDRREYRECVIVLNKILREDPYNDQVARLKQIAVDLDQGKRERNAWEDFNRNWKESMVSVVRATAIPLGDVTLPDTEDYRRAEQRNQRLEAQRRTQLSKEDIAVRSAVENVTLPLLLDETPLDDVIKQFRTEGRVNVIKARDVDGSTGISLDIGRVKLRQALDLVCDQADLEWRIENGAIIIGAQGSSQGRNVVRRVFNVADLLVTLRTFKGDEPRLQGDTQQDQRFGREEEQAEADPVAIDDLQAVIEESIDPQSWGLDGHGITTRQQDLIVLNNPDNIDKVAQLLADLRRSQGLTVSVESRFITIRDDFLEDIGLDFRGIGGSPQVPAPGIPPVPAALDDIQFGNNSNPAGPGGTGNDAGFFFQDMPPSGNVRIDQRARVENLFDQSLGGRRGNVGLTNLGGMSFQLAFVDNPEVNAILRAVRKRERATLLTAPRITVHNTQRAHVSILNEVAYIRDFEVNTAAGVAAADPVVDIIRDGIVLDVRPTISADRRYVTLELRPTLAVLLRPIPTFLTSLGVGTPVAIQTPQLSLQRIRTTVTVPDGGSFVIGGMRKMNETQVDSGIPILSDLPLIGPLFTRKGKSVVREDIIIVVSAHIIDLEEETDVHYGSGISTPR
ncbi:MAG: hypothetical protein KF754_03435 [Planctomycetes bacterium]|nr:hypothetical protein [Planctomycetota bacterium]